MNTYYPSPNSTGFIDLLKYANVVTNNHFGEMILLSIFAVSFLTTIRFGTERSFTVSMFITAMSSYFLSIFGLISPQIITIPTILLIVSIIFLFKNRENQ